MTKLAPPSVTPLNEIMWPHCLFFSYIRVCVVWDFEKQKTTPAPVVCPDDFLEQFQDFLLEHEPLDKTGWHKLYCHSSVLSPLHRDVLITFTTRLVWVDRHRFKCCDIFFFLQAEAENHTVALRTEKICRPSELHVFPQLCISHTHTHCRTWVFLCVCVCACPSHVPLQSSRPPATTANHRPPPHGWSPWQRSVGHVTSVYSLIITGARSPSPQGDTLTFKVEALKEQWRCFHPYSFFSSFKTWKQIEAFFKKNGNKCHHFSVQFTFNKYCVFLFLLLRLCLLDCLYCIIWSSNFLYFFFFLQLFKFASRCDDTKFWPEKKK